MNWSTVNITAVVSMSFVGASNVAFNNLAYTVSNQTNQSTNSPAPFILQNDGNALLNISLASSSLWFTVANPNQYYRFKADNVSTENGSFDWRLSTTVFTNVPLLDTLAVVNLNYTNVSMNSVALDLFVQSPPNEPANYHNATITFTSRLTE